MQQRYYDPIAARFLSTDPVTTDAKTGGHFNRYVYVNNNPYSFVDPDRQAPEGAIRQINREFERTQSQGGSSASLQVILGRYVEATGGGGASALNVVQMTSAVVRAQINEGSSPSASTVAPAAAAALSAGMVGGVSAPPSSPNFVVTPGGTAFPVPAGATGPTAVINPGGSVTGAAFTGGAGGANGQVTTMRIMNANPSNPGGYIKYENSASPKAQGVSPYSGNTVSKTEAHIPINR